MLGPRWGSASARSRAAQSLRVRLPGLSVCAALAAVAYLVARALPGLNPSTVAVVLGAVLANTRLFRDTLHPGTRAAGHGLLRAAIVLLGLQLSVRQLLHVGATGLAVVVMTVGITFVGTQLLGRALGVSPARRLLIATGFSICGASAVVAMEPVADGDHDDTAMAVALVTLCGSLAIVLLPLLRQPLGLDPAAFGSWVGASVHDVGQTVATANRVPGALTTAVVVKLTRVVLLAPLVGLVALRRRHRSSVPPDRQPPVLPVFVGGFLVAIALTSSGLLPDRTLCVAEVVQHVLLTAALVGLGTGIRAALLRRTGGRALALGLVSWLLVAATAYLGVRFLVG